MSLFIQVILILSFALVVLNKSVTFSSIIDDVLKSTQKCKLTHASALSRIQSSGIGISSSGNCSNRNQRNCTSLEQVRCNTITGIQTLKRASGCSITITGGTEVGHAGGTRSHWNGYKLDTRLNSCLQNYITKNFREIGRRGSYRQWQSSAGNIYCLEGNHW